MALLSTVAGQYVPPSTVTTVLREQLYEVVTNVDPYATQVLDILGGGTITSPIYQWPADSLPGLVLNNIVGSVDVDGINVQGITEGFEPTSAAYPYTGQPERLTNYIQLFAAKVYVTDTLKNSSPAGIRDVYNWEKVKAGRVVKKAIERRLFDNASANANFRNGTSTDPRAMKSLFEWITGNYQINQVTAAAGILPSHVDQIVETTVTGATGAAGGGDPTVLAMSPGVKLDLSVQLRTLPGTGWQGGTGAGFVNTQNINSQERRVIRSVDFYDGDLGSLAMMWTRQIPQSNVIGGGGKAWLLDPRMIEVGNFTPMQHIPLAKTGYNTKGIIVQEIGYMFLNPKSCGVINSLTT